MSESTIRSVKMTIDAYNEDFGPLGDQLIEFTAEMTPEFHAQVLDQWHRYYMRQVSELTKTGGGKGWGALG